MTSATPNRVPTLRLDSGSTQIPTTGTYAVGYCLTADLDADGRSTDLTLDQGTVRVTRRGHWYRLDDVRDGLHNDSICRGCGHHGHFDYILDYQDCSSPVTRAAATAALTGPARAFQPGDEVRGHLAALGGRFTATVTRLYLHDGAEVADVRTRDGAVATGLTPTDLRLAY